MLVTAWSARGGQRADPVLHASHHPPVPYSRTGDTYRAVCGRQVRNITTTTWNPRGPGRRCPDCVNDSLLQAIEDP